MEYVLDYSKWRCGGDSPVQVGKGSTGMLNEMGYQCCLGQFASQLGIPNNQLAGRATPADVQDAVEIRRVGLSTKLYDYAFVEKDGGVTTNTRLAHSLMAVNDNSKSAPWSKIAAIRALLEGKGHTLKVINSPNDFSENA